MDKFGSDLDFQAMRSSAARPPPQPRPSLALEGRLSPEELALLASAKMRCGGCGSKVGSSTLSRVLRRLQQEEYCEGSAAAAAPAAPAEGGSEAVRGGQTLAAGAGPAGGSILLGLDSPDDAAVLEPPPPGHVTVSP